MSTFPTPDPITASVEVVGGSVHVVATAREDTVVQVRPQDPNRASDVKVAEGARIDYRNGTLAVSAGRRFVSIGRGGAVTVDIELPSRSRLQVSSASAKVRADGEFDECRFSTASGDVVVDKVVGNIKADSASGDITVQYLTGAATISSASGDATVGELVGDVRFRAASGSLSVAAAVNGTVAVQTGSGDVEVGVPEGTAARLDLRTGSGEVRNSLQPSDGPADDDETLTVHVRTGSGDIRVQRATASVVG